MWFLRIFVVTGLFVESLGDNERKHSWNVPITHDEYNTLFFKSDSEFDNSIHAVWNVPLIIESSGLSNLSKTEDNNLLISSHNASSDNWNVNIVGDRYKPVYIETNMNVKENEARWNVPIYQEKHRSGSVIDQNMNISGTNATADNWNVDTNYRIVAEAPVRIDTNNWNVDITHEDEHVYDLVGDNNWNISRTNNTGEWNVPLEEPEDEVVTTTTSIVESTTTVYYPCGDKDWIVRSGQCYKIGYKANFTSAVSRCEEMGAQLVTIDNEAENNFIANITAQGGQRRYVDGVWIGITKTSDGKWERINGYQNNYLNWAPGQPDNRGGLENCVELCPDEILGGDNHLFKLKWNDLSCESTLRAFVCKKLL